MSINTRYTYKPKPISAPKPCIPEHLVVADVNSTCEGGLYVNTNMKHSTSSNAGPWARMQIFAFHSNSTMASSPLRDQMQAERTHAVLMKKLSCFTRYM